jgi:hypothetical protein
VEALGDEYEAQKPTLRALGLNTRGKDASKSIEIFLKVVRDSTNVFTEIRAVLRVLGTTSRKRLAIALVGIGVAIFLSLLPWIGQHVIPVDNILGAMVSIGATATAVAPAVKFVLSVAKRSRDIARSVLEVNDDAIGKLLHEELKLRKATVEAETLQEAAERSSRALATYIDQRRLPLCAGHQRGRSVKAKWQFERFVSQERVRTARHCRIGTIGVRTIVSSKNT